MQKIQVLAKSSVVPLNREKCSGGFRCVEFLDDEGA